MNLILYETEFGFRSTKFDFRSTKFDSRSTKFGSLNTKFNSISISKFILEALTLNYILITKFEFYVN